MSENCGSKKNIIHTKNDVVILVGIKHSGKTTTGMELAKKHDAVFFDVDDVIQNNVGMTVREFYRKNGTENFYHAELDACIAISQKISELRNKNPIPENLEHENYNQSKLIAVVATGGGICDNEKALTVLRQIGIFIYIEVSEKVAFSRIESEVKKSGWPSFICGGNPESKNQARNIFHEFYQRRTALYKKLILLND